MKIFFNGHLFKNHWADFSQTWQEASPMGIRMNFAKIMGLSPLGPPKGQKRGKLGTS